MWRSGRTREFQVSRQPIPNENRMSAIFRLGHSCWMIAKTTGRRHQRPASTSSRGSQVSDRVTFCTMGIARIEFSPWSEANIIPLINWRELHLANVNVNSETKAEQCLALYASYMSVAGPSAWNSLMTIWKTRVLAQTTEDTFVKWSTRRIRGIAPRVKCFTSEALSMDHTAFTPQIHHACFTA